MALMPFYRSKHTTDTQRLTAVCLLHPIVHEFAMMIQRSQGGKSYLLDKVEGDKKRQHFVLAYICCGATTVDAIFIMCKSRRKGEHAIIARHFKLRGIIHTRPPDRRFMLGVIVDPAVVLLAIVLTALEEVTMRATMIERDKLFRWIQGLDGLSDEQLQRQRQIWSGSSAM